MQSSKQALVMALILHLMLGILVLVYGASNYFFYPKAANKSRIINAYFLSTAAYPATVNPGTKSRAIKVEPAVAFIQHSSVPIPNVSVPVSTKSGATKTPEALAVAAATSVQTEAKPLVAADLSQLLLLVANSIQARLQYPPLALTHIEQGESVLQFELTPSGELQNIKLIQSSGIARLDAAAIAAIDASSPIRIPKNIDISEVLTLQVPVHFDISTGDSV